MVQWVYNYRIMKFHGYYNQHYLKLIIHFLKGPFEITSIKLFFSITIKIVLFSSTFSPLFSDSFELLKIIILDKLLLIFVFVSSLDISFTRKKIPSEKRKKSWKKHLLLEISGYHQSVKNTYIRYPKSYDFLHYNLVSFDNYWSHSKSLK